MNVVAYSRVSTDEQKEFGFSLRNQKERLFNYAKAQKYTLVKYFEEDCSAKTFNRPEWKKLKSYCVKHHLAIDMVIFTNWDRFSRNANEAQNEISWFKERKIVVYAIDNPLDLTIPESKIPLALYLTLSEIENDKLSLRVKEGLRRASIEGCWTAAAPYGYTNYRNPDGKSTLIPSETAQYIIDAFVLLVNPKTSIRRVWLKMREKGMKVSRSHFYRLIRNPVYVGKVTVKANETESHTLINGLHEPILPSSLFEKVQKNLDDRGKVEKAPKFSQNQFFPLRGYLRCSRCGRALTGSASTGSNPDRKYYYYHCRGSCGERIPLEKAHEYFFRYLAQISIDHARFINDKKKIKEELQKKDKDRKKQCDRIVKKIEEIQKIIDDAEDRLFEGLLDFKTFQNSRSRYLGKIKANRTLIENLKNFDVSFEYQKKVAERKKFINLPGRYREASFEEKKVLLDSILKEKIILQVKKEKI